MQWNHTIPKIFFYYRYLMVFYLQLSDKLLSICTLCHFVHLKAIQTCYFILLQRNCLVIQICTGFAYLLFSVVQLAHPKSHIKVYELPQWSWVKATVYTSQPWCLSATGRWSDKGCPKSGTASATWWERFGGKAATWLGQVNSFTLEFPAALTAAEFLEVCTWLFSTTLTFSDGLHWKMESQQAWISIIYPCLLSLASLVQTRQIFCRMGNPGNLPSWGWASGLSAV